MVKLLFWLHIINACPLNLEIFRSHTHTHICKMHSNHNYLAHTRETGDFDEIRATHLLCHIRNLTYVSFPPLIRPTTKHYHTGMCCPHASLYIIYMS